MGNAEIIQFPQQERKPDCRICEHSIAGADGTYCRMLGEEILFEDEAEECPEFEDDPWKG